MAEPTAEATTDEYTRPVTDLARRIATVATQAGTAGLVPLLEAEHPADIANALELLDPEERLGSFAVFPAHQAAEVLEELEPEYRDELLDDIGDERLLRILEEASADDAVYFLDHIDQDRALRLLQELDKALRQQLLEQFELPDDTAGHIMTRDLISFRPGTKITQIFHQLQGRAQAIEGFLYVTDPLGHYLGRVGLRELVVAAPEATAASIMKDPDLTVGLDTDREDVAGLMQTYHLRAVPVVDEAHRLCGQVTWDDAVDALEAEAEADMLALAGTSEDLEDNDPPLRRAWQRLPYLVITAIGGFIMAKLIDNSDDKMHARFPILLAFLPMVMALAGNIGIQCATVTVRSIATGELANDRVWRRSFREMNTGLLLAVILSLLCGGGAWALLSWNGEPVMLGLVIGCSLLGAIAMAAGFGVFVPLGCQRFGIDPAIAAGPFVTMLNDVSAVLIYLVVAGVLMAQLT